LIEKSFEVVDQNNFPDVLIPLDVFMCLRDFAEVEDFVNFGFEQARLEVGVALGDK
jgi:hypothetical protein